MNYIIKYNYNTGDSFHQKNDIDGDFDDWKNSEIAELNLKRLKEHYEYYQAFNKSYCYSEKERTEQKQIIENAKTQPWFVEKYDICVNLQHDDGTEYQTSVPWCGYFESLNWLKIEEENPKREYRFK